MTGYTVHTGSNEKFSQGWDEIFAAQSKLKPATKKVVRPAAKKATADVKKSSRKKVKRGKRA